MNGWRKQHKRVAPLVVASMLSAAAIAATSVPAEVVLAGADPGQGNAVVSEVRAQQDDQPPVTQVGEGAQSDSETLDEGAPPTEATATGTEDVETLDQGSPPASVPAATTAPAPVYEAAPTASPATTYVAPRTNMRTGPVLPPGFGMGRVHVSAGRFGFPAGLENCQVGAVTGRAYVGLGCGDGDDVVGHARSFEDFPFVPDVDFPFEGDEAFFSGSGVFADNDDGSADDVIVNGGGAASRPSSEELDDTSRNSADTSTNDNARNRDDTTSGDSAVSSEQQARQREPRVRVTKAQAESSTQSENNNGKKTKKHGGNATASNSHVSQAAKDDRSRQKSTTKAQHSGKKHKAKGGKHKKHDKHGKGHGRKKR